MANKQALHAALRAKYVAVMAQVLADMGEDVMQVSTNELAFPVVDSDGNDEFIVLKVQVPTGSRDGTPYDGYGDAEAFKAEQAEKAEKAAKAEKEKAAKKERDAAARAAKAEAKAKHEAELAATAAK